MVGIESYSKWIHYAIKASDYQRSSIDEKVKCGNPCLKFMLTFIFIPFYESWYKISIRCLFYGKLAWFTSSFYMSLNCLYEQIKYLVYYLFLWRTAIWQGQDINLILFTKKNIEISNSIQTYKMCSSYLDK